jgi:hypothetical protein
MEAKAPVKGRESFYFIVMSKDTGNKFKYFKRLYQDNRFGVLLKELGSNYWLKLRSISRKEILVELCELAGLKPENIKSGDLFDFICDKKPPEELIDKFISQKYQIERAIRKANEAKLVSELYKMKVFDWGGLYQNNLERTIVDNYVKKIQDFDLLNRKIENEIHSSMRGYVQCSWYNHWTSILIEDIFKDHKKVLPTVGLIKKVDFFICNIPFDLKVTYFPEGFMAKQRKEAGLPTELQEVKRFAKSAGIEYDRSQKEKVILSELLTRISESSKPEVREYSKKFDCERWSIIEEAINNYRGLIKWLYEEQGERRFDAANRLFLVLIDKNSLGESWKMKRNLDLLKDKINSYLKSFDSQKAEKLQTEFDWIDGNKYSVLSDVIFVVKE